MELGLNGKVVAITGASRGVGKAAALEYAKEGCKVAICARTKEKLEQTKKELASLGAEAYSQEADVTNVSQIQTLLDNTVK